MGEQVGDKLGSEVFRPLNAHDHLRELIDSGTRQLQEGEFTDYDSKALRACFDQLKAGMSFQPRQYP